MRSASIGAVAATLLALGAGPAAAQTIAGTLGLGWTDYLTPDNHASDLTASGSAVLTAANPGFNVQVNFNNDALEFVTANTRTDVVSYGGDAFWRDYAGSFGVNVTGTTVTNSNSGNSGSGYQNYGLFGQFFALPDLTVETRGGLLEGHDKGWYGGGGVVFYPLADVALSASGDYADVSTFKRSFADGTFMVEYLPIHEVPVSLTLGYTYADYSQLAHRPNVFLLGLKIYLGGGGQGGTLVDYQRNGTTNWDGAPPALIGLGF